MQPTSSPTSDHPQPISGFLYKSVFYPTEAEAVEAAIRDTAAFLMKEYPHDLASGLLVLSTKLQRLLTQYNEELEHAIIGRITDDD